MSASKVKFAPIDKAGKNDIPTDAAPNAISMAGGADGADRSNQTLLDTATRASGVTDEQFPTDALRKTSSKDELMTTKLSMSQGYQAPTPAGGQAPAALPVGTTPFGQMIASDEDFKWLASKKEQEAEANFQQWFATHFDFMSPEQKAAARELFPGFYEQRLKFLDKDLDTLRELARIKITGITNRRDLLLTYAAESGQYDVNRLRNLLNPEEAEEAQTAAVRRQKYRRGLLNPNRLARGVEPGSASIPNRVYNSKQFAARTPAPLANRLGVNNVGFSATTVPDYATETSKNVNSTMLSFM